MEITHDVIVDLLPLYLADEASPDTRTLVESHLERDPELAGIAAGWKKRLPGPPPPPVSPDAQTAAFSEAKRQIANRIIAVAAVAVVGTLAIAGTALIGALFLFGG
jgi:anti-sigma factor RsiW